MTADNAPQKTWFVYVIRSDDDQLYTGITTDINRRWREHTTGKAGARYFRGRKPQALCLLETHPNRSSASKREAAIKQLKRGEKEQLLLAQHASTPLFMKEFEKFLHKEIPVFFMKNKRACCSRCARPMRTCLCQWIVTIPNQIELIILQHPLEVNNAKNSARLLQLSLHNCRIYEGETFSDDFLHDLILSDQKKTLLLFPQTPDTPSNHLAPADPGATHATQQRLIMLDGTWRKCRKMLYLNPVLQQLPRLSLDHCPPSRYHIRKAHADNQLSTLEASCYALQQLENNAVDYLPLLKAFDGFVAQQLALIPPRQ